LGAIASKPFLNVLFTGAETLAYFLIGMALFKNGFLTGAWRASLYVRTALIGFAIATPLYALLAWLLIRAEFSAPMIATCAMAATVPIRPVMILAIAALVILVTRRGGPLVDRIAAAGRAAFTNYLGSSILMTTIFYGYGLGLYGAFSRAQLWLVVVPAWGLMLLWSKPWLDRFRHGPLEWLWRSLVRGRPQALRT